MAIFGKSPPTPPPPPPAEPPPPPVPETRRFSDTHAPATSIPRFSPMRPTVHHVGEGEEARIVKLTINLMIAGLAQLMSEALVLGEAAGVSREALLEVMGSSAAGAPFVKYKTEPLLRDDYSATFTTALMEKDIDLILDAAEEHGVELPVARDLKGLLRAAVEAGHADDDFIALFLQLRSASRYRDQEVVR